MDPGLRSRWLDALRSGEYEQGRFAIRKTEHETGRTLHCCLGVLDEICDRNLHGYDGVYLNCAKSGLDLQTQGTLMSFNDQQGASFIAIADWIEEHVPVTKKRDKKMEKVIMTKTAKSTKKPTWAVQNVKTGKVATTRESGYNRLALYPTREQARAALREGRVFKDPKKAQARIIKRTKS